MKLYSANYAHTEHNFVVQQLSQGTCRAVLAPTLCVVANLLHRGVPTRMSRQMQKLLGPVHEAASFVSERKLISRTPGNWGNVIKGSVEAGYYPAQEFFDQLPSLLPGYPFVQALIKPEVLINEITGQQTLKFVEQAVDFYLPQAKLVIEIDGVQHTQLKISSSDTERDNHLSRFGVQTIRIPTPEWRKPASRKQHIDAIRIRLDAHSYQLESYRKAQEQLHDPEVIQLAYLPTAILRI